MTLTDIVDDIKLELTGDLPELELEISDDTIGKLVLKAFKEVQRFIDETRLVEVPFSGCIDLTGFEYNHIVNIYRSETVGDSGISGISAVDPMYAQMMVAFGSAGGTIYNLQNYVLNFASYNTLGQMRNTVSTDLAFREDKQAKKLYINTSNGQPKRITIEYVPLFKDVDEIKSEHWQDLLQRLSLGLVKKTLGRIRTTYTLSNAPWQINGETLLAEGTKEVEDIRELMRKNKNMFLPVD